MTIRAHRFNTVHFKGSSIRSVSYYTLLREFLLPWPSSDCQNVWTPFPEVNEEYYPFLSCLEHSKAPYLLTKNGPRDMIIDQLKWIIFDWTYISSLRLGQELLFPDPQNIALTYVIYKHVRYPRRNFERNQLLGGSISLSPLSPSKWTNCTSVSHRSPASVSPGLYLLRNSSPPFGSIQHH